MVTDNTGSRNNSLTNDDDEDSNRRNRLHHDHRNRKSNKKSKGRKGDEHGKRRRHKMRGCDKELELALESESDSELENSADDDSASSYSSSSSSDIVEQSGASELSAALSVDPSQLKRNEATAPVIPSVVSNVNSASGSTGLERSQRQGPRRMTPMTREEYEAERLQIREVYDEETGRYRLVRGTGEILERIVSRSDHARINQQATRGDGNSFSNSVFHAAASKYRR